MKKAKVWEVALNEERNHFYLTRNISCSLKEKQVGIAWGDKSLLLWESYGSHSQIHGVGEAHTDIMLKKVVHIFTTVF
jgi:hypothetical protein